MQIFCQCASLDKPDVSDIVFRPCCTRRKTDSLLIHIVAEALCRVVLAAQCAVNHDIGIQPNRLRTEIHILQTDCIALRRDLMLGFACKNNLVRSGHLQIKAVVQLAEITVDRNRTGSQAALLTSGPNEKIAADIERIVLISHDEIALTELRIFYRFRIDFRGEELIVAGHIQRTAVQVHSAARMDQVALDRQRVTVQIQLACCDGVVAGDDSILLQRSAVFTADTDMELTEIAGHLRCRKCIIGIDAFFGCIPDFQCAESGTVIRHCNGLLLRAVHNERQIISRIEVAAIGYKVALEFNHARLQNALTQITGIVREVSVDNQAAVRVCHVHAFMPIAVIDCKILTGQFALGNPQNAVASDFHIAVDGQNTGLIRQRKRRAVNDDIADLCRCSDRPGCSAGDYQILEFCCRLFGRRIRFTGFCLRFAFLFCAFLLFLSFRSRSSLRRNCHRQAQERIRILDK